MSVAVKAQTDVKPTLYRVLFAISLVHLFNDSIQAVFPAMYPILRDSMGLSFQQLGYITFGLNFTASIMQPLVGLYTDKKPSPYLLPLGMVSTFLGMLLLALSHSYTLVLLSVVLVGIGSAVFHPEGSRVSHMAAGTRKGLAQSIFQVGGNGGQALAPIFTIFILLPLGQFGAIWFTLVAAAAIFVQTYIARWYREQLSLLPKKNASAGVVLISKQRKFQIVFAVTMLVFLVFARSWYGSCISNFYQFYLIDHLAVSKSAAQYYIFFFLAAGAAGTFFGGPLADRFGRRNILFFSMLGSAPFALLLPYASPVWAFVLLILIGFILFSSFSVAVVYAQELIPGKIGLVSGLITGLAFGLGAVGSVVLGNLIDSFGIVPITQICGYLPLFGLLTFFLPSDKKVDAWAREAM